MFNVTGGEFLIIFLVALIVLGPTKLPEAARQVGKVVGEFRRISSGFQREIQTAMNDPVSKVTGEPTPKSLKDVTTVAQASAMGTGVKADDSPEADDKLVAPKQISSVGPPARNTEPKPQTASLETDEPFASAAPAAPIEPATPIEPAVNPIESDDPPMYGDR